MPALRNRNDSMFRVKSVGNRVRSPERTKIDMGRKDDFEPSAFPDVVSNVKHAVPELDFGTTLHEENRVQFHAHSPVPQGVSISGAASLQNREQLTQVRVA